MIMIICLCGAAAGLQTFYACFLSFAFCGLMLIERFQSVDEIPWRPVTSDVLSYRATTVVKYFGDQTYLGCLDGRFVAPTIMPASFLHRSHPSFQPWVTSGFASESVFLSDLSARSRSQAPFLSKLSFQVCRGQDCMLPRLWAGQRQISDEIA